MSWQITPRALIAALGDRDLAATKRAFDAMMPMRKIHIAAIEAARQGVGSCFDSLEHGLRPFLLPGYATHGTVLPLDEAGLSEATDGVHCEGVKIVRPNRVAIGQLGSPHFWFQK